MLNMKKLLTKILTGFVKKTGDTMTGELRIKSAEAASATRTSDYWGKSLIFKDGDDITTGGVLAVYRAYGRIDTYVYSTRNGINNNVVMGVKDDGTPEVVFNYPQAWGNALTMAMGNPTIQSGVGATITANTSCRIGKQVSLNLVLNNATLAAGTANILTLPTGFRPKAQAFATLLIGGVYRNGRIDTAGLLTVYAGAAVSNAEIKVLSTFMTA